MRVDRILAVVGLFLSFGSYAGEAEAPDNSGQYCTRKPTHGGAHVSHKIKTVDGKVVGNEVEKAWGVPRHEVGPRAYELDDGNLEEKG